MAGVTDRELWKIIMHYGEFDRMPVLHWGGWPETYERWYAEGLPKNVDEHKYLDTVPMHSYLTVNLEPFPPFEEETFEETEEYRIFRQADGVIAQHWKHQSCIPRFIDFTLKEASCWE